MYGGTYFGIFLVLEGCRSSLGCWDIRGFAFKSVWLVLTLYEDENAPFMVVILLTRSTHLPIPGLHLAEAQGYR
jgi:hypothetical protein